MPERKPAVVVKKLKPYPFDGDIMVGAQKKPIEVIFISTAGLIIRLKNQIVHVGEYYQLSFELPGDHGFVDTKGRVLKTYDKSLDSKELKVERMAEFHFQSLTKEHRSRIVAFLAAIGQTK